MVDLYQLVFRAEVLEGQHPAVVRKRLQAALKIREDQLDKLFSGSPVVLKKAADTKTAARYQRLFKEAGARLRVLPVRDPAAAGDAPRQPGDAGTAAPTPAAPAASPAPAPAPSSPAPTPSASAPASSPAASGLSLAPPGSAMLAEHERPQVQPLEISTDHLRLAGAVFDLPDPESEPAGAAAAPPAPEFSLASAGSDLLEEHERARPAAVVVDVDFEVAEAGADLGLGTAAAEPPPPAPDTSALQLVSD